VKKKFGKTLASAIEEVAAAEEDLSSLLPQIRVAPRAEKTTVSKKVEDALSRLRAARTDLLELQKLVTKAKS
jgi:hypothetical protein